MRNWMKHQRRNVWLLVAVLLGMLGFGQARLFAADERPGSAPTGADAKLTDQQIRGQGLFCSVARCATWRVR